VYGHVFVEFLEEEIALSTIEGLGLENKLQL
jgi:hypothetical protein